MQSLSLTITTLVVLPLTVALSACGGGPGETTGSTCPPTSTLTYASFGQAFFQANCVSCHGASGPESPALVTLEQIRTHRDTIDRSAAAGPNTVNTYMPEGGSLPEAERRQLGEWLACGAPE